MKWISFFVTMAVVACASFAHADAPPSYRQQHPLAWMHGLPTGEQAGWSKPWWFNFETSVGNVWNAPLIMNDSKNGKQYEYTADFEQVHGIIDFGAAIGESFATSLEIPYAYRSGGAFDGTIDAYHLLIGNRRFNRQYYPKDQNIYSIKTDGADYFADNSYDGGVANIIFKMKYWLIKSKNPSCACGVGFSSQTKFPVQDEKLGGTTGDIDQSLLLHIGLPLFTSSSVWLTAGQTFLGENPSMKDWPRYKTLTMYELNLDLAISPGLGIILNTRAESPFLDRKYLDYYDASSDPTTRAKNRAASGWNSLVYWRGTQSLGLRYQASGGNQIQFLVAEDWGLGPYDSKDGIYSNNASDVNFIIQMRLQP